MDLVVFLTDFLAIATAEILISATWKTRDTLLGAMCYGNQSRLLVKLPGFLVEMLTERPVL